MNKSQKQKSKFSASINLFSKGKLKKEILDEIKDKYLTNEYCTRFLVEPDILKKIITEHEPIDNNEWLATHSVALFKQTEFLIDILMDCCNCPEMISSVSNSFLWIDDKGKKAKLSSNEYFKHFKLTADKILSAEDIMPTQYGSDFPPNFIAQLSKVYKPMLHILIHTYICHFNNLISYDIVASANTILLHLYLVVEYNSILDIKEFEPLEDLIKKFLQTVPATKFSNNSSTYDQHQPASIQSTSLQNQDQQQQSRPSQMNDNSQ